jgi:hypothetical protein
MLFAHLKRILKLDRARTSAIVNRFCRSARWISAVIVAKDFAFFQRPSCQAGICVAKILKAIPP